MSKKLLLSFLSLLFLSSFFLLYEKQVAAGETVTIKADILNVRSGPGLDYQVVAKVYQDEKYPVLEEKNNWIKIKLDNGEAWVAGWFVEKENTEKDKIKVLESNVTNLNVRKGPSLSFSVTDQIQPETKYPVLDIEGDWVKIQLNSEKQGWVAKWLVTIAEDNPSDQTLNKDFVTILADILNVRTGPSIDYEKIGTVKKDEKVEVVDINNGWYKIKYKEGFGWIAGEFAGKPETNDQETDNSDENQVIVNTDILNLRKGPGLEYEITGKLYKNDLLIVHQSSGEWLYITKEDSPELKGWIANWLVEKKDQVVSNKPTVIILNPGTNLREGPSTSYKVVGTANTGDQFPILAKEGDWYQIQLSDETKAYVAGWIVSTKGLEDNITHGIEKILKDKVIVLDPGHGGRDNGATGFHFNSIEKILNYNVAVRLEKKLEAAGARVILTRTADIFISLQDRVDIAAYNKADIFISIHHNSNDNPYVSGTITYYYDSGDRKLASIIQSELVKQIKLENKGIDYGRYHVLRENPRVAVLVEIAFLSNYQDELKARSDVFQEKAAEGLFQGIIRYFNNN